jgi:hypothetical protein
MNKDWNKLLEFETRDGIDKFVKNKFNRIINKENSNEIIANFNQGREFFKSALSADFSVRPLLQYYWVLSLSRWLILALNPWVREANIKPSHWLCIKNWDTILKDKNFWNLEICIEKGSFYELMKTTDNKNYLRANSNIINYECSLNPPSIWDILKLEQLIQYYPDLNYEFQSWTNQDLTFIGVDSISFDTNGYPIIQLQKTINEEDLDKFFPKEYCIERICNDKTITYKNEKWWPNITQQWDGTLNIWNVCIVPVLKNDIGLNLISGMFMISYVFGMMARYYPTAWLGVRRGEKWDKIYPFAHRIAQFIDEKFPKVVLDILSNHTYIKDHSI